MSLSCFKVRPCEFHGKKSRRGRKCQAQSVLGIIYSRSANKATSKAAEESPGSGAFGATPLVVDFATVAFTKLGPHCMLTTPAACAYVWLIGCVLFEVYVQNASMVVCRHELHVGREPPGNATPTGR